jgi:DNA repair protein RadC
VSRRTPAERYARLEEVLNVVLTQREFSLDEIRASVPGARALAGKLVGELEREGHLTRGPDDRFSWSGDAADFSSQAWLERKVFAPALPQTPRADRPRERLLAHGAASLRTADLLAILIRAGRPGESAVQAGERIAARYSDELDRLAEAGRGELKALAAAVGETAYCQIMAGIELGRRVAQAQADRRPASRRILGSDDAVALCRQHFARLAADGAQEEFHVVCLDTKNQMLGAHRVAIGSLDRSLVHPREVFRPAIRDAAKAILLVHNHPSGDPTPSEEDLTVTRRLEEAGQTLGIWVLDHIIVARAGAVSIKAYRGG